MIIYTLNTQVYKRFKQKGIALKQLKVQSSLYIQSVSE